MSLAPRSFPRPSEEARAELRLRLQARRPEIERAISTRVNAVSDPGATADPEYLEGLRAAVLAALDYSLAAIERGEERSPPIPTVLLSQARLAARNGISLDTVLRRYFAGYALLGDCLIEVVGEDRLLDGAELKHVLRAMATVFDRLLAAVSEEHNREFESRGATSDQRRAERVERLLAGEWIDTADFNYDFDAFHLGVIAKGPGAADAARELAGSLDRRLLLIRRDDGAVWAWLGGRRQLDLGEIQLLPPSSRTSRVRIAFGEPGDGLGGWRLTHRQARAAMPIAMRSPEAFVRYADVALLASMHQDDLLVTSLREIYLVPLERGRDGGELARETLRAYFAAERNVASAAAALGVSRQAVAKRIRAVEEALDRTVDSCGVELEAVLRLEELGARGGS